MSHVEKSFVTSVNTDGHWVMFVSTGYGILLNARCCFKCFHNIACMFLQAKDNLRRELVMYDSLGEEPRTNADGKVSEKLEVNMSIIL